MKRILIIEDDELIAGIYRNKFQDQGFAAEFALDGESGLEKLDSYKPDLVLLDLMLPTLSGLDLLKQIRAKPGLEKLPVIVLSSSYLTNMVKQAQEAGATRCFSKANCAPKQIIEAIRTILTEAPAPVATTAAPGSGEGDTQFQSRLSQEFIAGLPDTLQKLRHILQATIKSAEGPARSRQLEELYRLVHSLTGSAGVAGLVQISQMADALEALLRELCEKSRNVNASTLRTVTLGIDFLGLLFERSHLPEAQKEQPPIDANILVVDDEAISRRALVVALERSKLEPVVLENPTTALKLLSIKTFDLIFLDIQMPGMNGFELCTKIRALDTNKRTPVIFVTSLTDFQSRANSSISGGTDFIAKPFLFVELGVRALIYLLRSRIAPL